MDGDDDFSLLQKSFHAIDRSIKRAGLLPSFEQLELLSTLIKFDVQDEIMDLFWKDYFKMRWRENLHDDNEIIDNDDNDENHTQSLNDTKLRIPEGLTLNFGGFLTINSIVLVLLLI